MKATISPGIISVVLLILGSGLISLSAAASEQEHQTETQDRHYETSIPDSAATRPDLGSLRGGGMESESSGLREGNHPSALPSTLLSKLRINGI